MVDEQDLYRTQPHLRVRGAVARLLQAQYRCDVALGPHIGL